MSQAAVRPLSRLCRFTEQRVWSSIATETLRLSPRWETVRLTRTGDAEPMSIVRILLAIAMIVFGLVSFPYPREDRHKVGLALGCISFVIGGVVAMLLASWWAVAAGIALGFGIPFIHLSLQQQGHSMPKPPANLEDMSAEQIVSWLEKQKKWRALGQPMLELLARRLQGTTFPGFYFLCERANIDVGAILGDWGNPDRAVSMLASSLHLTGSNILEQWASQPAGHGQPDKHELKELAKIAYESAIALEPYHIPSYATLAQAHLMTEHDTEKADEYLRKGLQALEQLHSLDSLPEERKHLLESFPGEDMREMLAGLKRDIRTQTP